MSVAGLLYTAGARRRERQEAERPAETRRATEQTALLVEAARFDTTQLLRMEAEAVRQAGRFGLDPIDLLLACESILKAGLEEIASRGE